MRCASFKNGSGLGFCVVHGMVLSKANWSVGFVGIIERLIPSSSCYLVFIELTKIDSKKFHLRAHLIL
jgi:hypothetical protein